MRGQHLNEGPQVFLTAARTLHVGSNTICVAVWLYRVMIHANFGAGRKSLCLWEQQSQGLRAE
jgi:hypothetical protein